MADGNIRGYMIIAGLAVAASIIASVAGGFLIGDSNTLEIVSFVAMAAGAVAGIVLTIFMKRRSFIAEPSNRCTKLRDVSSILSFVSLAPMSLAMVFTVMDKGIDPGEFAVIAALIVFVSMLVQAVFWKYAQDVGSFSTGKIIMLVASLILMNVSSISALNDGGLAMYAVAMVMAVMPVILMFDWAWSADIAFFGSLICAVIATIIIVIEDPMQFGRMLLYWIPTAFVFLLRNTLKQSFLIYEGKRLF
jgi:hypothetical protein